MAPAIQPNAAELESNLDRRQTDSELREQGILKHTGMASSIQPHAESIQDRLESRRTQREMIEGGLMQDPRRVAPALQGASQQLADQFVGRQPPSDTMYRQPQEDFTRFAPAYRSEVQGRLERRLSRDLRPDRDDLVRQGILPPGYWDDWQTAEREHYESLQKTQQEISDLLARRLDIKHFIDLGLTPAYFLEKDFEDAHQSMRAARQNTEELLARRLDPKRRMSTVDLEMRNYVPEGYFADHHRAEASRRIGTQAARMNLQEFLPNRPAPESLARKHIVDNAGDFNRSADEIFQMREIRRQTTGEELANRLRRRPSVSDVVQSGVVPEDYFSDAVKDIAKKHRRLESAADELSSRLPMPNDVGKIVAKNWLVQMDTGLEDENGVPVSPLDEDGGPSRERRQMKRRLSQTLDKSFKERPSFEQLQKDGILPRTKVAPALQGAAVNLQSKLDHRLDYDDLKHRNIVRRPSVSASLQPAAESLEEQFLRNYRILHHTDRIQDAFYRGRMAASLQSAANQLHRRRTSLSLKNALNARPTKDELIDMQILLSGDMASSLQGAAHNLQEQLRTRVPEDYLGKRGILPRSGMAASIQPTAERLESQVRQSYIKRRDSLTGLEGGLLPRSISPMPNQSEGENAMDQLRRDQVAQALGRKIATRLTKDQVVAKGIVPTREYFEDWEWATQQLEIGRRLHAEDLKRLLKDRDQAQDLVSRGLIHPAYLQHDPDTARAIIRRDKKIAFQKLSESIAVPKSQRVRELEERNILPKGYIEQVSQGVFSGDLTEREAIEQLTDKLLERSDVTTVIAEQLVSKMEADEDSTSDLDDGLAQQLERQLSRRMSVDQMKAKNILFSDEMAPAIQQPAQELEKSLQRRPSISDVVGGGILKRVNVASSIQPAAEDLEYRLSRVKSREEVEARGILIDDDTAKAREIEKGRTKEELKRRLGRGRRATVYDLELRGIVPGGYFDDVKSAINTKRRRRDSIVKELASRLRMRPDVTEVYASRILSNAIEKRQDAMNNEIRSLKADRRQEVERALNRKLDHRRRPSIEDLSKRGVLPFVWDPTQSQANVQRRLELEKQLRAQAISQALQSRKSPEDMMDHQYIYSLQMAPALQGIAKQLESQLQTRVGEEYLQRPDVGIMKNQDVAPALQPAAHLIEARLRRKWQQDLAREHIESAAAERDVVAGKLNRRLSVRPDIDQLFQLGITKPDFMQRDIGEAEALQHTIRREIENRLDKNLRRRPSVDVLHKNGIVPYGAFQDPQSAAQTVKTRRQSVSQDLFHSLQERPDLETLYNLGYLPNTQIGTKSREEQRLPSPQPPPVPQYSPDPRLQSPQPPPPPARVKDVFVEDQLPSTTPKYTPHTSSMISSGLSSPPLPPAPKPVRRPPPPGPPPPREPVLDMNVVVAPPDLHTNALMTSPLAFQSLLDQLEAVLSEKRAEIDQTLGSMQDRMQLLKKTKQVYFMLVMGQGDDLDDFKSSGDLQKDTDDAKNAYLELQNEIFEKDIRVQDKRKEMKKYEEELKELTETRDKFQAQMSALRRVANHLGEVLRDQETHHDSAMQARKATELEQGFMIARITDKIAHTHLKIDQLNHLLNNASDEVEKGEYAEELSVSTSFLNGLQEFLAGLRRIRHEQAAKIRHIERVIDALKKQQVEINEQLQKTQEEVKSKLESARRDLPLPVNQNNFNVPKMISRPPLSFADLQRKRRQRMSKVTRKLQELEQRALSTSSSDYLRSLTEIKQLQQIVSDDALKHFFNTFVQRSNQIFNDVLMSYNTSTLVGLNGANPLDNSLGIKFVSDILAGHGKGDPAEIAQGIDSIVSFVQSLPDREVVIMQIGRYLAMSPSHRTTILECTEVAEIEVLVSQRCREWVGSILSLYGNKASCKTALSDNIIAQVQPHFAAALVCDTVFGLDVHS